ncbi:MAG: hypothetical protein WC756_01970 [Taibaiella sp.]|jgi:hypothetical protein
MTPGQFPVVHDRFRIVQGSVHIVPDPLQVLQDQFPVAHDPLRGIHDLFRSIHDRFHTVPGQLPAVPEGVKYCTRHRPQRTRREYRSYMIPSGAYKMGVQVLHGLVRTVHDEGTSRT